MMFLKDQQAFQAIKLLHPVWHTFPLVLTIFHVLAHLNREQNPYKPC